MAYQAAVNATRAARRLRKRYKQQHALRTAQRSRLQRAPWFLRTWRRTSFGGIMTHSLRCYHKRRQRTRDAGHAYACGSVRQQRKSTA